MTFVLREVFFLFSYAVSDFFFFLVGWVVPHEEQERFLYFWIFWGRRMKFVGLGILPCT